MMKSSLLKFVLVGLSMFLSTLNHAHDYRLISVEISKQQDSDWKLMLDFKTSNILESLQQHYLDETLQLSHSHDFKERLKNYLKSTIRIEVIKHFNIQLEDVELNFNDHVTNIMVSLQGVPARPDYWDIHIGCGTESKKQTVMLRFNMADHSRLLKLSAENNYQTSVIKGSDGMLRVIKN